MTLVEQVTEILKLSANEWSDADWRTIDKGNYELGRAIMYDILGQVGPKTDAA